MLSKKLSAQLHRAERAQNMKLVLVVTMGGMALFNSMVGNKVRSMTRKSDGMTIRSSSDIQREELTELLRKTAILLPSATAGIGVIAVLTADDIARLRPLVDAKRLELEQALLLSRATD